MTEPSFKTEKTDTGTRAVTVGLKAIGHLVVLFLFAFAGFSVLVMGLVTLPFGIVVWLLGGFGWLLFFTLYIRRFTTRLVEGTCPHCGMSIRVRLSVPAVTCPACLRRSVVRDGILTAIDSKETALS